MELISCPPTLTLADVTRWMMARIGACSRENASSGAALVLARCRAAQRSLTLLG
jgi:hypothetical protein